MNAKRNQPCPCKSGKKAKKCCLLKCCELCLFSPENYGAIEKKWKLNQSLVRQNNKHHLPLCPSLIQFHPKTIIICGNGSVYWRNPACPDKETDTWALVQKCVDDIRSCPEGRGAGIPSEAKNFLHWLASTEKLISYFTEEYPSHNYKYAEIQGVQNRFREHLGKSFQQADIRLRSIGCFHCQSPHYLDPHELKNCGFLTLNWDSSIRQLANTIELHGTCELPGSMVLPNQDLTRLLPKNKQIKQGFEALAVAHHWLSDCENVIIWGCKLNDYDAIISVIISIFSLTKFRGKIGLFVSIPSPDTRQAIENKLHDYFPLANFYKCLSDISE